MMTKEQVWEDVLKRTNNNNGDFTEDELNIIRRYFWNKKCEEIVRNRSKKYYIVAIKDGFEQSFNTIKECALKLGIPLSSVCKKSRAETPITRGKNSGWSFKRIPVEEGDG